MMGKAALAQYRERKTKAHRGDADPQLPQDRGEGPLKGDWSLAEEAELRRLHAVGLLYGEIGKRLGRSRRAIGAKVDRLGLQQAGQQGARRRYVRKVAIDDNPASQKDMRLISDNELFTPVAERKSLSQLGDGDCKFPHGDPREPSFHYCSKPAVMGKSYCPEHCRRVFVAPKPQRVAPSVAETARAPQPIELQRQTLALISD